MQSLEEETDWSLKFGVSGLAMLKNKLSVDLIHSGNIIFAKFVILQFTNKNI